MVSLREAHVPLGTAPVNAERFTNPIRSLNHAHYGELSLEQIITLASYSVG